MADTALNQVIAGQGVWQLYAPVENSGSVFSSDVGGRAFAIGPRSDIARVRLTSLESKAPGGTFDRVVTSGAPFIGQIDPNPSATYPTGSSGSTIITIDDILPFNWLPSYAGTIFESWLSVVVTPFVELIQYLNEIPNVLPTRLEKKVASTDPFVDTNIDVAWNYPVYGRELFWGVINNRSDQPVEYQLWGTSFSINDGGTLLSPASYQLDEGRIEVSSAVPFREDIQGWDYVGLVLKRTDGTKVEGASYSIYFR